MEGRNSFAIGTEVGVVADGTLIARALDVLLVRFLGAKGAITVDAKVNFLIQAAKVTDWFIKGRQTVARVVLSCAEHTSRAVIPVRAAQALVTDPEDELK